MQAPSTLRTLLGTERPPFLLLTPACLALGLAVTRAAGHAVPAGRAALVLPGALAAHASVNMLNEWHDARSGLDATTRRTPFSAGSGALQAKPAAAPVVPAVAPWVTRHPLPCLLAPGPGFGPLMVVGTQLAIAPVHHASTRVASQVPMALLSGLLLLNQLPDVEADRAVGRRHLPMLLGRARAARVFAALVVGAQAVVPLAVAAAALPRTSLLTLATLPLAFAVARCALRNAQDIGALLPMGRNVALTLLTPLVLALALWASAA
jgi:1,4-dihydroxy-2-naphthoate octaprenyltransferase